MIMKYWGFFLLKLVAGALLMRFVWAAILLGFRGPVLYLGLEQRPFGHDLGYTTRDAGLLPGLLRLSLFDRLGPALSLPHLLTPPAHARSAGSWPNMLLFGQPRTEYICLYGHGTLKVPEFRVTTKTPDWERHGDDIWKELESLEESKR